MLVVTGSALGLFSEYVGFPRHHHSTTALYFGESSNLRKLCSSP